MLRVQVSVQVGSLTVQVAVRDLEPLQGRQPAGLGASSGKRQQHKTARKRKNEKNARLEQEQQQQQQQQQREQQGGVATVQSSANTVDVRGQRALEVGLQYWCK